MNCGGGSGVVNRGEGGGSGVVNCGGGGASEGWS